jgi:hypothetical protein
MLDCGSSSSDLWEVCFPLWSFGYSVEMRKITDVLKEFTARYIIREYEMLVIITIFA